MTMPVLPEDWAETRSTLQAYAQALTAIPRAAGTHDDRWGHVAMTITDAGLMTAPTPLGDGANLFATIDLTTHEIVIETGEESHRIDIGAGPSSRSIGDAMNAAAAKHGTAVDVDIDRFGGSDSRPYDSGHAAAFHAVALCVVSAFDEMNTPIPGEITGPHLWPHGFDIATEWYSDKTVPHDSSEPSAQIAVGFYPSNESYFYANPWPFEESWSTRPLVTGSTWHLDDWQGAVLSPDGTTHTDIVAFGAAIHALAREALS